jgi:hypothetical protein
VDERILDVDPALAARDLIAAFVAHDRVRDARAVAALFLRCSQPPLRSAVASFLDDLGPVEDDDERLAILNAATHSDLVEWPRWLGVLPARPELAATEQEIAEELAVELWIHATSEPPPSAAALRAAVSEVIRVTGGPRQQLIREVRRTAGTGVAANTAAEEQDRQFGLAWDLSGAGLLAEADVADLIVEACADTLRHDNPSPTPTRRKLYEEKLLRLAPEAAADIILDGVRRNRPRVLVGNDAKAVDVLVRALPATYVRVAAVLTSGSARPARPRAAGCRCG